MDFKEKMMFELNLNSLMKERKIIPNRSNRTWKDFLALF